MARRVDEGAQVRERLSRVFGSRSDSAPADPVGGGPGYDAVGGGPGFDAVGGGPAVIPPGAAFDPGRRGARALAVVAVLVLAGAAALAWQARPRPATIAPAPISSEPVGVAPGATAAGFVVVAVTGRVRKPGLVRLPAGSRVADAIEAAGGVLPGTDLSLLNVARKVSDGELIAVGVSAVAGAGSSGGPGGGGPGGKVNLNTATLAQLDALPGIGPVLAQRILDHRQRHGGFRSITELRQVDGIGAERYEQLKDLVTT